MVLQILSTGSIVISSPIGHLEPKLCKQENNPCDCKLTHKLVNGVRVLFYGEMYSDPICYTVLLAPAQLLYMIVIHAEVMCDLVDQRAMNFLA